MNDLNNITELYSVRSLDELIGDTENDIKRETSRVCAVKRKMENPSLSSKEKASLLFDQATAQATIGAYRHTLGRLNALKSYQQKSGEKA